MFNANCIPQVSYIFQRKKQKNTCVQTTFFYVKYFKLKYDCKENEMHNNPFPTLFYSFFIFFVKKEKSFSFVFILHTSINTQQSIFRKFLLATADEISML